MRYNKKIQIEELNKKITELRKDVELGVVLTFRQVEERVRDINEFVRSDDNRLEGAVIINHEDGSHFFLNHAWCEKIGHWLVCFTEHQGVHTFSTHDLSFWSVRKK